MRSDLMRRPTTAVTTRRTARHFAAVQQPASDAAARIQAAGYAAHCGLVCAEILTSLESQAIQRTPLIEPRTKAIVDQYAGLVCTELAKLAL